MIFRGFSLSKMAASLFLILLLSISVNGGVPAAHHHAAHRDGALKEFSNVPPDVEVVCGSDSIKVTISTQKDFSGMIYPKGLTTNNSCLAGYDHAGMKVSYVLPLRSCNTMSHSTVEGVEYFNTVVVEPHHKLVTSYGQTFNVRCRYESKITTVSTGANANDIGTTPSKVYPPLPYCDMKIFVGQLNYQKMADRVLIGDFLTIVISIDKQDFYGLKIANCIVKDGLGELEQPLINNEGCPVDKEIMGPFEYSKDLTSAHVTFPAHKFPDTPVVYYQCNVKICSKKYGGCYDAPPVCDATGHNLLQRRQKRQNRAEAEEDLEILRVLEADRKDRTVEVFSGVYVKEDARNYDTGTDEEPYSGTVEYKSDDEFCVSNRKFAIGIAIAGVLLLVAIILIVACIVQRRRRKQATSTAGSSIYSGPYSNHAYSRD